MSRLVGNGLNLNGQRITNLADPSSAQDAATLNYVQGLVNGVAWHPAVLAASGANVSLTAPGTSIDGVTLTNPCRILLMAQTTASQNGVYTWTGSGITLTRVADMNSTAGVEAAVVLVEQGTSYGNTAWTQTADNVTVDTNPQIWVQFGGMTTYTAGNGINVASAVITAVPTTGVTVTSSGIGIDTSVVVRKYAANIGDGSSTTLTVTHNLGTLDVQVTVYATSGGAEILADVTHATTNTVTIAFATAPAAGAYRAVCFA